MMNITSDDLKLKHPATIVVSGQTKAGKSSFIARLIKERDHVFDTKIGKILYFYGAFDKRYLDLSREIPGLILQEGLPAEILETLDVSQPSLVILDDLIASSADNPLVGRLFMQTSHHNNMTVVLVTQNLFYQGKQFRNIMKNASVIVLMNSLRDHQAVQTFSRQLFPKSPSFVYDAYTDAMKDTYGYLLINLDPATNSNLRVVRGIFAGESYTVYRPK